MDEIVRRTVGLDNLIKWKLDDGVAVLPSDEMVALGDGLFHALQVYPPARKKTRRVGWDPNARPDLRNGKNTPA